MIRFLLVALFAVSFSMSAQDRIRFKDIAWPVDSHNIFVPEEWSEKPAVILERVIRYQRFQSRNKFTGKEYELYYKIKFQNNDGAETYRYFFIPKVPQTEIDRLDARLTKPDGRVADFDSKFFKDRVINTPVSGFSPELFTIIEVPTVESGDQLELFWRYQGHPLPQNVFFDDYLPTVRSTYLAVHPEYFPLIFSNLYGCPEPKYKEEYYRQEYRWRMEYLPPRRGEAYFSPARYLPHIQQAFAPQFADNYGWDLEWWIYLRQLDRAQLDLNARYDKRLEALLDEIWKDIPTENTLDRIKAVHNYINKNVRLTKYPRGINIGHDLQYGRIHPDALYLFYDDLFRRFDLPYKLILAKEKNRGPLDSSLVTLDQISHAFFQFSDRKGQSHFVMPLQWSGSYALNEIPGSVLGTEAVFITAPSEEVSIEKLPSFPASENEIQRSAVVNLNGYETEVRFPVRERWTGAPSMYWAELRSKEENPERPPFKTYLKWEQKWPKLDVRPDLISFDPKDPRFATEWQYIADPTEVNWMGDTLTFLPQDFLQTEEVYTGPVNRIYPLYLPYSGTEKADLYLQLPFSVLPMTVPGYNWKLPGLLEAEYKLERIDSRTYRLHFACTYLKETYSASEAVQMRTLWREMQRTLNKPFRLIKI